MCVCSFHFDTFLLNRITIIGQWRPCLDLVIYNNFSCIQSIRPQMTDDQIDVQANYKMKRMKWKISNLVQLSIETFCHSLPLYPTLYLYVCLYVCVCVHVENIHVHLYQCIPSFDLFLFASPFSTTNYYWLLTCTRGKLITNMISCSSCTLIVNSCVKMCVCVCVFVCVWTNNNIVIMMEIRINQTSIERVQTKWTIIGRIGHYYIHKYNLDHTILFVPNSKRRHVLNFSCKLLFSIPLL